MRKYSIYKLTGLFLLLLAFASCETLLEPEQEAAAVAEPNEFYPVIESLTMDNSGTITEGDTIVLTLKTNRPIDRSITYTPVIESSTTLVLHDDYDLGDPVTISPWETEGKLYIYTYADLTPEEAGTISVTFEVRGIAEKYLLNPENVFPSLTTTVANYKSPNLNLEFIWEKDIDLGEDGVYPTSNNVDFDIFVSTADG